VLTTMRMFSRAIVESAAQSSAMILAITDSVDVTTSDERARPVAAETQRQLAGRQMRLRLSPDGTVGVAEQQGGGGGVPRAVNELVAVMPASFPRGSVAVGDTWLREMPIPPSASMGVPLGGIVKASFKLDSLSDNGDIAYLTMRGTMHQMTDATAVSDPSALTGAVNGSMVVDRRRGWLSESRFLVEMRATVAPIGLARPAPMQFRLKITQHMRVLDKRP